jgi:hypothetical protein
MDNDALVHEAEAEVRKGRAQGRYSPELLNMIESGFELSAGDFAAAPEALAHIPSGRPLHASGPLGPVVVAAKRLLRRMLAWYVQPIAADQSRFNEAILTELRRLERRVQHLEAAGDGTRTRDNETG